MTVTAHHTSVDVSLGSRSYPVIIGENILADAGTLARETLSGRHVIIIADAAVDADWRPRLEAGIKTVADKVSCLTVPGGEASKSVHQYGQLMESILALGVDRKTVLVALGGGVIGDLVGFAAASLLRGVDFIQVPTTLLAMVDSSVGGKTGINAMAGKNLIGAFHQPRAVLADTACLKTLPEREMRAGYAEVVKYGLLGDADFFDRLENSLPAIMQQDPAVVAETVAHCCRAKAAIVAADERESGKRALLNLGHTFGHAYEAEAGYDGSVLHGEAIAAGMVDAFRTSERLGLASQAECDRVKRHLDAAGLPTHRSRLSNRLGEAAPETLITHMRKDKKAIGGTIVLILPHGIGDARVETGIDEAEVMTTLSAGGGE